MKTRLAALMLLAASACGPDFDRVQEEFIGVHPEAVIHELFSGEGDSENAYVHIRYSEAGKTKEAVWLYQSVNDRWLNTHRGSSEGSWEAVQSPHR